MNQFQEEEDKYETELKRGSTLIQAMLVHKWAFVTRRSHKHY